MRVFKIFLSVFLTSFLGATGQSMRAARYSVSFAAQNNSGPRLRLSTQVVDQKYCDSFLVLYLRLTFSNLGSEPVILSKKSISIAQEMVSPNLEAAAAREYSQQGRYEDFGSDGIFEPPLESDFVTIKPGGEYGVENDRTRISLTLDKSKGFKADGLLAGNYLLQVEVNTWLYISVDENSTPHTESIRFRDKWRDKGFLWSDPVVSVPMALPVAKDPPIVTCR